MEPLNLRLQEYRLALLIFRAGCLLAFNTQTNSVDRMQLLYDLFEYCYYRYLSFDTSINISARNKYSVKSFTAKARIVVYLYKNKTDRANSYCDKIFGKGNWENIIPLAYM